MSSRYSTLTRSEKIFAPLEQKSFTNVVKNFFRQNFPQIAGSLVLDMVVNELTKIIELYYPPLSRLKMGQMLWFAVSQEASPGQYNSMSDTALVPVVLTVIHPDDIAQSKNGIKRHIISQSILARLYNEAKAQGGVLTETELSLIRNLSITSVSKQTLAYESSNNAVLPRRGTVHDLGPSVTHKKIICQKHFVSDMPVSDIARQTHHSFTAVSRYINDFERVLFCLRKGFAIDDISFAASLSKKVVYQYVDLILEFPNELPF